MRVYSFQSLAFLSFAAETGRFLPDEKLCLTDPETGEPDDHWSLPYLWMADRVGERIGLKEGELMFWVWPCKPSARKTLIPGQRRSQQVLLTFDVDPKRMAPSLFDPWHLVLNGSSIVEGHEMEGAPFAERFHWLWKRPEVSGWDGIFDVDWRSGHPLIDAPPRKGDIQAVIAPPSVDDLVAMKCYRDIEKEVGDLASRLGLSGFRRGKFPVWRRPR